MIKINDLLVKDAQKFLLEDMEFEGEVFEGFDLNFAAHTPLVMNRVSFRQCKFKGVFWIGRNVHLTDVIFDNIKGPTQWLIESGALLQRVVISGGTKKTLLQAFPHFSETLEQGQFYDHRYDLDISGFKGEADLIGVDVDRVVINPDKDMKVKVEVLAKADWGGLNMPSQNRWTRTISRIESFNSKEAIMSHLFSDSPNYEKYMFEYRLLRDSNLVS